MLIIELKISENFYLFTFETKSKKTVSKTESKTKTTPRAHHTATKERTENHHSHPKQPMAHCKGPGEPQHNRRTCRWIDSFLKQNKKKNKFSEKCRYT